jgi:excinuclease ABC subunit A
MMLQDAIIIQGASENNLKNISLSIPKNKLVVLTGPSGSGKSSLAMDTLQQECTRKYMESLGMSIDFIKKPKVDKMSGLSPSISIGQRIANRNPRSTVGTVTGMYTYLRLIFEKLGERKCPHCKKWHSQPVENEANKNKPNNYHCPHCHKKIEKITISHFSFNTPEGACPTCDGLGKVDEICVDLVFNEMLSLKEGCVTVWKHSYGEYQKQTYMAACQYYGIPIDENLPLKDFTAPQKALLYHGVNSNEFKSFFPEKKPPKTVSTGKFEGVLTGMRRRFNEKNGKSGEAHLFHSHTCPDCKGKRLKPESREILVAQTPITDLTNLSLEELSAWLQKVQKQLSPEKNDLVKSFFDSLAVRIQRIIQAGLGYLSLDRQTITLSGGEAQRLKLASIIESALTGVLYILDEPTAGLHPKDTYGLIEILKQLRDLGNTVLVIEHDTDVMRNADYIIDMGPGAGGLGGEIVGEGSLQELMKQRKSITGAYLQNPTSVKTQRRTGNGKHLTIHHAHQHNLKNITVSFPLNHFISVTGVSGSGKSTLIFEVLAKSLQGLRQGCEQITGTEFIHRVITVGQSPLSRMKRSNIATYTDVFTSIRNLYASLPESKEQKLRPKDFSYNTSGGRCEHCQGMGTVSLLMHFLPEQEVECPVCHGKRFEEKILKIKYKGYSISDILDLSIEQSLSVFKDHKKISPMIRLLCEIGLGYLKWGQPLTTLSGGEGQRLKLAKELKEQTGNQTLYLLDEPSVGLHPTDVNKLLVLLHKLVDAGNTVVVVEHNSQIIRSSDWVIDLGPGGGIAGGRVIAEGTPESIRMNPHSYTGKYL